MSNTETYKVGDTVYINYKSNISSNYILKYVPAKVLGISDDEIRGQRLSLEYFSKEANRMVTTIFHSDWVSKEPKQKIEQKSNNQTMKTPEQIDQEISELQAKIESLKKEKESQSFEAGDWFVVKENGGCDNFKVGGIYEVIQIENQNGFQSLTARFNETGNDILRYNSNYARKATESEIEAHLIKLAEESGLKIGGKVPNRNYSIEEFKLSETENSWDVDSYKRNNKLKYCLKIMYQNGVSSASFDHISYQQSKFQHKIVINGYTAEFNTGFVSFGCARFDNSIFTEAQKFIETIREKHIWGGTNRSVENIKLGAGIFTPNDINNIVKQLKS